MKILLQPTMDNFVVIYALFFFFFPPEAPSFLGLSALAPAVSAAEGAVAKKFL